MGHAFEKIAYRQPVSFEGGQQRKAPHLPTLCFTISKRTRRLSAWHLHGGSIPLSVCVGPAGNTARPLPKRRALIEAGKSWARQPRLSYSRVANVAAAT